MGFWQTDKGRRALSAYLRGGGAEMPSEAKSGVKKRGGKSYVILASVKGGILKVYRVRNDGMLKGLRRWPKTLEER